jgi:hypothetical protein
MTFTPLLTTPVATAASTPVPSTATDSSDDRVEESRPAVYYLPDKQGNLQPILDFRYQDFVELYKLKNQLERRNEPPRYSLQRMIATGVASGEYAELNVQFQVLVRDDEWIRIPLRFQRNVLRGEVQYKGVGEHFVHYEGDDEGYVCWVRGKSDTQHEIALKMLVPLVAAGDETRLKLIAPRATVSELKLTVPMAEAIASVSEGATLLPSVAVKADATELNVVGLGSDFQLAWHKANPRVTETPLVLEASGTILTRLDGRSISSEAVLSVRSYGAAFDRFIVQLPPGAELSTGNTSGYSVVAADKAIDKNVQPGQEEPRRAVEVRLLKKTVGPVDIRLACRRDYDPLKKQTWCELGGFEVVGATRQWGVTAVATGGDWQVLWGTCTDVRQTDSLPDALQKEDIVAGFEYSTQPYSLPVRLVPRKTRISVDPSYILRVERDVIYLEGKLSYRIRGAKITTLNMTLPGWVFDEVGPENIVAVDVVTTHENEITIPLMQPTSGTLGLQVRAHRVINAKAKSLTAALPQPQAGISNPALVAIVPADNVELEPNSRGIEGLIRQRMALPMQLPERQQEPLFYRATNSTALFAADFRIHPQRITVDVATRATLNRRTADVEQRWTYSIAYEPTDRLTIAMPRKLATEKHLQILCDGKPLTAVTTAEEAAGGNTTGPVLLRVALPSPRIGTCELVLLYSVPLTEPTPQLASTWTLSLPMPENGVIVSNSLSARATRDIRILPRKDKEGVWSMDDREAGGTTASNQVQLTATKRIDHADFDLRWTTNDAAVTTIIDRAWIQSWFTSSARQDRAAYQLITDRKDLEVIFPIGAAANQAVVWIDGSRVEGRLIADDRLLIPLPGRGEGRRFAVELRYHFPDARPPRGSMQLAFPQIGGGAWTRRMYWQLILPADEHLISNPSGFVSEFTWGWRGYFWGRQPLLDQSQLESWVGVGARAALPEHVNIYLFSSLGCIEQAEIVTAGRTWIVLLASGVALVVGLLLIYVPTSRHPATLLIVGIILSIAGLIVPEPTLLLLQAASLGLVLTLLAGLLERSAARRLRRTSVRKESSSERVERGSTHTSPRPQPAASPIPSETASNGPPQFTGEINR